MTTAIHSPAFAIAAMLALLSLFFAIVGLIALYRWSPKRQARNRDESCRQRQIDTLRKDADAAVASRSRVRAHGAPLHPLQSESAARTWLRGVCCHSADCADRYCPGRLQALLDGTGHGGQPLAPAAKVAKCRQKAASASVKRSGDATETEAQQRHAAHP